MTMDMNMSMKSKTAVLGNTPEGGYKLDNDFSKVSVKGKVSTGPVTTSLDSDAAPVSGAADPFAVLKKGMRFQYTMDPQGRVTGITGLNETLQALSDGKGKAGGVTKQLFSEDNLKNMLPDAMCFLPSTPVKPGDHWPCKMAINTQNVSLNLDSVYTFSNWEVKEGRKCAVLSFTGTMDMNMDGSQMPKGMKMSMKGSTLTGKVWFDPKEGQAIDTQGQSNLKINMTFPMPALEGKSAAAPMSITMEMNQNVDSKLDKIE